MARLVRDIAQLLPDSITESARNTIIEDLYYRVTNPFVETEQVVVDTAVGSFELLVPEGRRLPGGKAYSDEVHEPVLVHSLENTLSERSVFYDIGARYGYFIGIAKALGVKPSNIHGFEQHPLSFYILSECWGDDGINLCECMVGNPSKMKRVDEYTEENQTPDVIKIDVEGAEVSVLRSAVNTIARCRPHLFIEVHPRRLRERGKSPADLESVIADHGYEIQCTHHRETVSEGSWHDMTNFQSKENTYLLYANPC